MPLTEPVHFTVLPGDGTYPRVLRQLFGLRAEPLEDLRSDQNPKLTLLLCPLHPSSAAGRAAMYSKGVRFPATYLFPEQCASLAEILNVLASKPSEEHEILQLVHGRSYRKLIHDLKYLFCFRGSGSSWFYFDPYEDKSEWVKELFSRLNELQSSIEKMKSLVGSAYDVDCIEGILNPFVKAITDWFSTCDLSCHPSDMENRFFQQLGSDVTNFQQYILRADDHPSEFNRESLQIYSNIQFALEKPS